ncbi:uncharacterized protein LOC114792746 isoform X5 [Denticeps clupeoides]|uniref:uncharacterized protein LOC114792746 isoform X5 n=1 Tax=Denticeps clupeoides TaxID=299321 RepID=UPI0010A40647|nr:uncharacterized protein LOC114792746 isoform X5 [Denticeps clupeoides]
MTTGPQTNMDELQMQKQGRRLVFQIFPEPVSDSVKTMCGWEQEKKRLPSIIVEATEATELAEDEGGALRWPPQGQVSFDEEEDPFVDQSVPSTSDNIRKKNEKDMSGKKGAAKCRCAQSVEPGQLDFSRLTPPSSPTDSEAMPACLRRPLLQSTRQQKRRAPVSAETRSSCLWSEFSQNLEYSTPRSPNMAGPAPRIWDDRQHLSQKKRKRN